MALSHALSVDHGIAVITISGRGEGADLLRLVRTLFDEPDFRNAQQRLWDTRGLSYLALDIHHIQRMSDTANRAVAATNGPSGRTAIVANAGMHADVLTLFEHYTRGRPLKVFTEKKSAMAWLKDGHRE